MERTLESITSPSGNNSFGSSKKSIISKMSQSKTPYEERKLTGTGAYKIDAAILAKQAEEDDDNYDDDEFYSDDFEEDESDDDA